MRITTIPMILAAFSVSGCLNLDGIEGPTAEQAQTITTSCQYELGLESSVIPAESAKLSDCISRTMIAQGFAKPAPVLSAFEQHTVTAQQTASEMNRFCPNGAAVLYSGSTYCVGLK